MLRQERVGKGGFGGLQILSEITAGETVAADDETGALKGDLLTVWNCKCLYPSQFVLCKVGAQQQLV